MNIDIGSLFFNASLDSGGGTASWGTALGQSQPEYKFTYPGADEILIAMNYCNVPLSNSISCKLGKGGSTYLALDSQKDDSKFEIILASVFKKVYIKINESKISVNKPFALLITKEKENIHTGRRTLKYSDSIKVGDVQNIEFYKAVSDILGGQDVCWFAYAIDVENQDELIFSIAKVNDNKQKYTDSASRKSKWQELIPSNVNSEIINDYTIFAIPKHSEIAGSKEEVKNALVKILEGYREKDENGNEAVNYAIPILAFEYYNVFETNDISPSDRIEILEKLGIKENSKAQLNIGKNIFKYCLENFKLNSSTIKQFKHPSDFNPPTSSKFIPTQRIYYGVPGCGKSHAIDEELKNVKEYNVVRVVFHPEYSNADFVGQIMPEVKTDGTVNYKFKPGPLSLILRRAYLNPSENFYLVIEEINRGNAAAIFGEMFQLFDRIQEDDSLKEMGENIYGAGWSSYFVQNDDVCDYIRDMESLKEGVTETEKKIYESSLKDFDNDNKARSFPTVEVPLENGTFKIIDGMAIRFPPNLSILATMNSSDQNVFTLDNAFQRRIDMVPIKNEFGSDEKSINQKNAKIAGTNVTWGKFHFWINQLIMQNTQGMNSTEDKQLGVWFVKNKNGEIDSKTFTGKVLKYLWDDVFKLNKRALIFEEKYKSLTDLNDDFEQVKFEIFKNHADLKDEKTAE